MRSRVFLTFTLLCAIQLFASDHKKLSDAESSGFLGPVKSVSTDTETVNSPPIVRHSWLEFGSVFCRVCVFDEKGSRVMQGQDWGSGFMGERTRSISDESGHIREQIVENEKGEIVRRVSFGPSGMTEIRTYRQAGPPFINRFQYDENGQMKEAASIDESGTTTGVSRFRRDADGHISEAWNFAGSNNKFLSHNTDIVDPDSGARRFTQFNEDMTVRLTYTAKDYEVVSYWQQPNDDPDSGPALSFAPDAKHRSWQWYHPDGSFEKTTKEFVDDTRPDPKHEEFYDGDGRLQVTVDYDYEFDNYKNWTKRTVWAWTPELGARQVIKIDRRTLVYWPK